MSRPTFKVVIFSSLSLVVEPSSSEVASCVHDEKIQEYREAHETGKCGDFCLGQRNARISVGQIGRLDRNPVTLHGGLKISDASHQSLDTGACVQVLGTSVVVASVMSYP